jgi:CO/xanthine dehydrogenase FAD-binding subunit
MRNRVIGAIALALSHLLPSDAVAVAASPVKQFTIESLRLAVQALTPEQRAQRALEAKQKVERNRRCRPAVEKAYAEAIDDCRKRIDVEQYAERRKCFGEALDKYYKSLRECPR